MVNAGVMSVRCLVSATVIVYIICICVVRALVLYPRSCHVEFRLWQFVLSETRIIINCIVTNKC